VQAAQQQERFAIFVEAPRCDEQYVSLNRRTQPYNRLVALPLALSELEARLSAQYYRQPAALASDIATIASNACTFNGDDSELAEDAAALAAYLTAVLQGQVRWLGGVGCACRLNSRSRAHCRFEKHMQCQF
jgi:hypothetical protein